MNKAFEKILERLEERKQLHERMISYEHENGTITEEYQARKAVDVLNDAKKFVQEVAEEYNGGWIPCSERLPDEYGEYLIWWTDITGKQYYEITEYEPDNGWIGDIPQAVEGIYNVIAWQPLPEPYNQKGE